MIRHEDAKAVYRAALDQRNDLTWAFPPNEPDPYQLEWDNLIQAIRNGMEAAGIPVENSKGEWGKGQEEINLRYADALEGMALAALTESPRFKCVASESVGADTRMVLERR